jgi:hypothetical protein
MEKYIRFDWKILKSIAIKNISKRSIFNAQISKITAEKIDDIIIYIAE